VPSHRLSIIEPHEPSSVTWAVPRFEEIETVEITVEPPGIPSIILEDHFATSGLSCLGSS